MAYCKKCGNELEKDDEFCTECGTPVTKKNNKVKEAENNTKRKTVYAGDIKKCPACGENIKSFTAICPSCGHEINSKKVSSTLQEFTDTINEYDKMIANDSTPMKGWKNWSKGKKFWWVVLNVFTSFIPLLIYLLFPFIKQLLLPESIPNLSLSEKKLASIIENYAFPKDRESILDAMVFIKSKMAFLEKNKFNKKTLYWSNLWSVKAEELYKLGKMIIKNDNIMESTYVDIVDIKNKINKNVKIRSIICAAIIIVYTIFILISGPIYNSIGNIVNNNVDSNDEKIIWLETGLSTKVPEVENKKGKIWKNSETELEISLDDISYNEFERYVTKCNEFGYNVNATKKTDEYLAYNNDDYYLDLSYIGSKMYIKLYAPLKGEENFEWPTHQFATMIPKLENKEGSIKTKEENKLEFSLYDIKESEIEQYFNDCEKIGFSIDIKKEENSFKGFNKDGYKLSISYDERKSMTIIVEAPRKMEKISWPSSGPATLLPKPKFSVGNISIDFEDSFSVYIDMTKDEFNNYIDECLKKGFEKDYRFDTSFSASKGKDVDLRISYEGFNIVYISITDYR